MISKIKEETLKAQVPGNSRKGKFKCFLIQ